MIHIPGPRPFDPREHVDKREAFFTSACSWAAQHPLKLLTFPLMTEVIIGSITKSSACASGEVGRVWYVAIFLISK